MAEHKLGRRDFFKAGSASALVAPLARPAADPAPHQGEKKLPLLGMITNYSPQKLAFAASAHYQGVVVPLDRFFDPDKLSAAQIGAILATARRAGVRIISIECMFGVNHIAPDPAERRRANERFIRCLHFAHALGCKFTGTFSGGRSGASLQDQAKAFAEVVNEKYLPVCEKLNMNMGWENYPCDVNFATVPSIWSMVFDLVPSHRLGLEFDPSHLVRQYIDPVQAAWDFRDRILAVHAKDTEIIGPVLQQVGIHGQHWWRYRIPGQGLIDWPRFITVLLESDFSGGIAVEHEDPFWNSPPGNDAPDFPQARKDGFVLAERFLRMYLPGRLG